jgi:cation:H+ antiporter
VLWQLLKEVVILQFGNIIGSNIFNMLFIIGISSLFGEIRYNIDYNLDMIILCAGTLLLALFPSIPPKNQMNRGNGCVYLIFYLGYILTLIFI